MLAKTHKKNAENVRKMLLADDALDVGRVVRREGDFVFFPLKKRVEVDGAEFVEGLAQERIEKPRSLKEALAGVLDVADLSLVPSAYTVIGDIAFLELPDQLLGRKNIIGEALLSCFPNVKVAALKISQVDGEYRVPGVEVIAGENRTETVHRENGCFFKLDIATVYFNPRTGSERERVSSKVTSGERVLVLFAGVGPYAVHAAKRGAEVWAVELNPDAVSYMRENARLNKVDLKVVEADARDVKFDVLFDRVIMPLPKQANNFLDVALSCARESGVIHYYCFAHNSLEAVGDVIETAGSLGYKTEILESILCGTYSPCLNKYCVDFRTSKIKA
ncbi:MAG: class I SAM-dependent methyltransferase family protein [Candidatus Altiarchaeota archaeon]|nr:class I SAM-dependent methyltransferase family protein [Candidatus Altiarchaeota archaeon]